ncbi:protein TAPETUM DETERMINANT 1-like protein [Cinnamomum micranthum f. kanehirae]|uniref:Protein TAPETUM DETERMINANT 1-like protein n=1 Tax=Cinnamomum micranthum f. kanehirae TaxID=337451 RepID=A0A3S3MAZ2_9MAGN|nr:protein TAPETUM DETERMINANT 1-like protein [Cinnamomum micranthum f. kanehirae]
MLLFELNGGAWCPASIELQRGSRRVVAGRDPEASQKEETDKRLHFHEYFSIVHQHLLDVPFHLIVQCFISFRLMHKQRYKHFSEQRFINRDPEYIVQIANTCLSGCAPFNIHFHCGWFASAKLVNPNTLKRLSFDDCLVNAGRPLRSSQIIRFTYTNSFMYPITFKSARFC